MPFPGISFWVVCARISALQSISISMNLGMDCCKVTETSKSPPYNTCFSSSLLSSRQLSSPMGRMSHTSCNGWDKNQTGGRARESLCLLVGLNSICYCTAQNRLSRTCPKKISILWIFQLFICSLSSVFLLGVSYNWDIQVWNITMPYMRTSRTSIILEFKP